MVSRYDLCAGSDKNLLDSAILMTILSGNARLAGITGWPVGHSRSPRLHGFWLERHGIDGAYVPLRIEPAHYPAAIRGLMRSGFAGG